MKKSHAWITSLLLSAALLLLSGAVRAAEPVRLSETVPLLQEGDFTVPKLPEHESDLFGNASSLEDTLLDGLQVGSQFIDLTTCGQTNPAQVRNAYAQVVNTHPDLFYVRGTYDCQKNASGAVTSVEPQYDAVLMGQRDLLNQAVNAALAVLEPGMTQVEQLLALHDYLVRHVSYNWEVATGHRAPSDSVYTAYGALVNQDAVCQGYALAYELLLQKTGFTTTTCLGPNHIWNMVQLDGRWYHVDVTWDDPVPESQNTVYYNYFLICDKTIEKQGASGHIPMDRPWGIQCTDTRFEQDSWLFRQPWIQLIRSNGAYYGTGSAEQTSVIFEAPDLQSPLTILAKSDYNALQFNGKCPIMDAGRLYFMSTHPDWEHSPSNTICQLFVLELSTRQLRELQTFYYTDRPSADGVYPADFDSLSMTKSGDRLLFHSSTNPGTPVASFAAEPVDQTPTIFYESAFEGPISEPQTAVMGQTLSLAAPADWPGHRFLGWSFGTGLLEPGDPLTLYGYDIHLHAVYAMDEGDTSRLLIPTALLGKAPVTLSFAENRAALLLSREASLAASQQLQKLQAPGLLVTVGTAAPEDFKGNWWYVDPDCTLAGYSYSISSANARGEAGMPLTFDRWEHRCTLRLQAPHYDPLRGDLNYFIDSPNQGYGTSESEPLVPDIEGYSIGLPYTEPGKTLLCTDHGVLSVGSPEDSQLPIYLANSTEGLAVAAVYNAQGRMLTCHAEVVEPYAGLWKLPRFYAPDPAGCAVRLYLLDPVTHVPLHTPWEQPVQVPAP